MALLIVPLLFAYTPLIRGSWVDHVTVFIFAFIGIYCFAAGFQGYMENYLNPLLRLVSLALAFFLIGPWSLVAHLLATAAFAGLFYFNFRQKNSG